MITHELCVKSKGLLNIMFFLNMLKYLMPLAVPGFHSAVLIEHPVLYKVANYKS